MPQTVALVVNPTAARGRGGPAGRAVARLLSGAGHAVVDLTSATPAEATERAARAVRDGVDALVVVGGDGMAHLGANACAGSKVPMGLVAAGTGNDVARGLGLPVGNAEAGARFLLQALEAGSDLRRRVDAVRVHGGCIGTARHGHGERWFVGVLAAGFDAVVNERANGWSWPRGRARYDLAIARELPVFRPIRYAMELDGRAEEVSAMLVAVANGRSYGGGMRVAPDARDDDGLVDVVLVRPVSTLQFARIFPTVYSGRHVQHPAVSIRRARRVRLQALDRPVVGYADGERLGPLPLECETVAGALTVLAPTAG